MVLLTFYKKHKELMEGTKVTTIRRNAERWNDIWSRYQEAPAPLDMWWRSPRTKHPDCYKMGMADFTVFTVRRGKDFTVQDARYDGFKWPGELIEGLGKLNLMDEIAVREWPWGIIHFEWRRGYPVPTPEPKDRPYWEEMQKTLGRDKDGKKAK